LAALLKGKFVKPTIPYEVWQDKSKTIGPGAYDPKHSYIQRRSPTIKMVNLLHHQSNSPSLGNILSNL